MYDKSRRCSIGACADPVRRSGADIFRKRRSTQPLFLSPNSLQFFNLLCRRGRSDPQWKTAGVEEDNPKKPTPDHCRRTSTQNRNSAAATLLQLPTHLLVLSSLGITLGGSNADVANNRAAIRTANMSAAETLKAELVAKIPLGRKTTSHASCVWSASRTSYPLPGRPRPLRNTQQRFSQLNPRQLSQRRGMTRQENRLVDSRRVLSWD